MLDGRHHQVSHVVTGDAACGGEEAHGFPVTAVECEGDPHSLAIVAADLEAIGTPAPITFIDRDATVMSALGEWIRYKCGATSTNPIIECD